MVPIIYSINVYAACKQFLPQKKFSKLSLYIYFKQFAHINVLHQEISQTVTLGLSFLSKLRGPCFILWRWGPHAFRMFLLLKLSYSSLIDAAEVALRLFPSLIVLDWAMSDDLFLCRVVLVSSDTFGYPAMIARFYCT